MDGTQAQGDRAVPQQPRQAPADSVLQQTLTVGLAQVQVQQVPGSPFQNPPPMQLMQTWSIDVHASSSVWTVVGQSYNPLPPQHMLPAAGHLPPQHMLPAAGHLPPGDNVHVGEPSIKLKLKQSLLYKHL